MTAIRRLLHGSAFVPLIIVIGLSIRLIIALFFPIEQMSDSAWYVERAIEIASGLGFQEGGVPTAYWPIGWPAILAGAFKIFGSIPFSIIAINTMSAAVTMYLIYWFGKHIAESVSVGKIALLAYALYPNHIAYVGNAATEITYTALIMTALAILIAKRDRGKWVFVAGLIFGLATLVKPQTLIFPFGSVIALALVYQNYGWRNSLKAGFFVYIGLLVVVLPWTYRNYLVFGDPILVSTNGGTALILGANDQMTGRHFEYQDTPVYNQFGIPFNERISRQVELNQLQKARAVEWIIENPVEYVTWMPKKVLYLWLKDTDGFWAFDNSYPSSTIVVRGLQLSNQLLYLIVMVFAIYGAYLALKGMIRGQASVARLALLYYMPIFVSLLAAVFTGQIRYHFPAMPFLFVASAWVFVNLARRMNRLTNTDG